MATALDKSRSFGYYSRGKAISPQKTVNSKDYVLINFHVQSQHKQTIFVKPPNVPWYPTNIESEGFKNKRNASNSQVRFLLRNRIKNKRIIWIKNGRTILNFKTGRTIHDFLCRNGIAVFLPFCFSGNIVSIN